LDENQISVKVLPMKKNFDFNDSIDQIQKRLLEDSTLSSEDLTNHHYVREETAPIPSEIDQISLKRKQTKKQQRNLENSRISKREKSLLHQELLNCTVNQKSMLFLVQQLEEFQKRKIKSLKVKERLIALRKIKQLSYKMQKGIFSQMAQDIEQMGKDPKVVEEFAARREERHFQIDRIIKYLSNP